MSNAIRCCAKPLNRFIRQRDLCFTTYTFDLPYETIRRLENAVGRSNIKKTTVHTTIESILGIVTKLNIPLKNTLYR